MQSGIARLPGLTAAAILGILRKAILPGKDYKLQMQEPAEAKA